MSDALPIVPGASPSDYERRASELLTLPRGDESAVRSWAAAVVAAAAVSRRITADTDPAAAAERMVPLIAARWVQRAAEAPDLSLARAFVAAMHGFDDWPTFTTHLEELCQPGSAEATFERAADAIVHGDIDTLRNLLQGAPALVTARSTREHHSTLLHYVAANGVEDFRQQTPGNIVEIAGVLLTAGADVNAESDAYGGGATALGLAATSLHPQRAGVQLALLGRLLEAGASIDRPGAAGNGHDAVLGCLANGQPEAAAFLASRGARLQLVSAAGVGRLAEVDACLSHDADAAQVQNAFMYACGYGHLAVARRLLDAGADVTAADATGETALHWAAGSAHPETVAFLLAHGAAADATDRTWQATPLEWALYTHATDRDESRRPRTRDVVGRLLAAGATWRPEWAGPRLTTALRRDVVLAAMLGLQTGAGESQQ